MRPIPIKILCIILFFVFGIKFINSVVSLGVFLFGDVAALLNDAATLGDEKKGFIGEYFRAAKYLRIDLVIFGFIRNIFVIISIYWLWKMKKWGVYLFFIVVVLSMIVPFILNPEYASKFTGKMWMGLILPTIYLMVIIPYWKELNPNKRLESNTKSSRVNT